MHKNILKLCECFTLSKIILVILIFTFLGFITGKIFGINFSTYSIINVIKDALWNKKMDISFLTDVAAFEAAIISFLIPLSFDIVSKVSERYQSELIVKSFEDYWINKHLPYFLISNIVLIIIFKFLGPSEATTVFVKVILYLIMAFFIFIAFLILLVIRKIKLFATNTRFLLNELFEEAEGNIE